MSNVEVNLLCLLLLWYQFLGLSFEWIIYWSLLLLVTIHIRSKLIFISAHHMILFEVRKEAIVLRGECALHDLLDSTWIWDSLDLLPNRGTLSEFLAWFPGRCDFLNRLNEIHWGINLDHFSCRCYDSFVFLLHYVVWFLKHWLLHVILPIPSVLLSSCPRSHHLSRCSKYIDKQVVIALRVLWWSIAQELHRLPIVGDNNLGEILLLLHGCHRMELDVSTAQGTNILQIVMWRNRSQKLTGCRVCYAWSLHTNLRIIQTIYVHPTRHLIGIRSY